MIKLKVVESISSAHHLRNYEGKCARNHGHNFKIAVEFSASKTDDLGLGCDFSVLRDEIKKVTDPLDHQDLNEMEPFKQLNPTAENLSKYIFEQLKATMKIPNISVIQVSIWETDHYCASYSE